MSCVECGNYIREKNRCKASDAEVVNTTGGNCDDFDPKAEV